MGNYLYSFFFQATNTVINDRSFEYRRRCNEYKQDAMFEIEIDDFFNIDDIHQQLKTLADPDKLIANRIETDIIPALKYYLNDDSKLYTNKAILSQTDYFIFKLNYVNIVPLLQIKNRQAVNNREKLQSTLYNSTTINDTINNATTQTITTQTSLNNKPVFYIAVCYLSHLWNGV